MTAQRRMSAAAYLAGPGRPKERAVQVPLMTWIRANVSACSWHTRNESKRHTVGRMRDAQEGVLAGVADIVGVIEVGSKAGRLFAIEVKRPGSSCCDVSAAQNAFAQLVLDRGGLWTWVTDAEQGKAWCHEKGIVRPRGWVAPWVRERVEGGL